MLTVWDEMDRFQWFQLLDLGRRDLRQDLSQVCGDLASYRRMTDALIWPMRVRRWFLLPWLRKPIRWVTPDLSPFWVRGLVNRCDAA